MLTQSQLEICLKYRFLAPCLSRLTAVIGEDYTPSAVDGEHFFCHPDFVAQGSHLLFHGLIHCLLGHPFLRDASSLACDLAVAMVISEIAPEYFPEHKNLLFKEVKRHCMGVIDPISIGALLDHDAFLSVHRSAIAALVTLDDHSPWQEVQTRILITGQGGLAAFWQEAKKSLNLRRSGLGQESGNHRQKITLGEGTHHEFAGHLRRYAVEREYARDDPNDFQYAWYAYGLEHYGNMPLIEPMEYRMERRLEELVIAIDTSGSCARGLTQQFLEQTRDIILREKLFFQRFNLHILQCDAQLQRDDKITSIPEFERYIEHLEIIGGGGTNFCPVFEHIDHLIAIGELRHLKGMLYFTDGRGIYPSHPPKYEATFVFLKHRYDAIDTPRWGRQLVLDAPLPRGNEYMEY